MNQDKDSTTASHGCITCESPLLFMHIPKTGGMSMFTAFAELWGTAIADLYDVSPRNSAVAMQAVADRSKILYCGHYAFGLHGWLDRPVYYASVLREPVARLTSLYHYCQPMLTHYRTLFERVGGDLRKLHALPRTSDFYFDFVECFKAGLTAENFFASNSPELDNGMVRRFSGYGINPAPCPPRMLAQAKHNIERYFSVVGLLERYPETLSLMSRVFNLPTLAQNQVNVNTRRPKSEAALPPGIISRIRAMNALDIELYEWVAQRFDAALAGSGQPIAVAGGGGKTAVDMPLWRAVGQSPLREKAMKDRGLPRKKPVAGPALVCRQLVWAGFNEQFIMADVQAVPVRDGKSPGAGQRTRLMLTPETAKLLAETLTNSIAAHAEKFNKTP